MSWWTRFWRRRQLEAQLEDELRFHLEQHTAQLIERGRSPDQALREARLALGGPEQVKEKCRDARGTRWLEDLLQDTRYALRTFRIKPGFTLVALLILALGIGATTVMFAVINSVLLRPLPYPQSDRLLTLRVSTHELGELWGFSNLDFADIQRQSQSLTLAAWTYGGGTISSPGNPEYLDGRQISADLFSTLGISTQQGRAFQLDEDRPGAPPVAIISQALWHRDFAADPRAVGSSLVFEGQPYTIVGIAPAGFQLDGDVDIFTPLQQRQTTDIRMQNRAARFLRVMARLRPGNNLAEGRAEITTIALRLAEQFPQSNAGIDIVAYPLQKEFVGDVGSTLWLLLGAVGLVLLIACVNMANLLLARAVSRERELAMRVALGAGRSRLARQCLTESAILGLAGGLLGVLLAYVSLRPFVAFWPGSLPRAEEVHLDWRVLLFAVAASLACGLLFGLAPALRVPTRGVDQALRAGSRSIAGTSRRLHSAFVISEIALAVVLLVSAGMLGHTLLALSSLAPGFNVHNVLAARFALSPGMLGNPKQLRAAWLDVLERARRVPGVSSAAIADIIPMRAGENSLPYWTNAAPPPLNQQPLTLASCVTLDYLDVMGIPLRQGRFFNEHDRLEGEPVAVIDDNLAQHAFGAEANNAVGKHLWIPHMDTRPVLIIGVVGHVRHWGLAGDDQSRVRDQLYYPFAQVPDQVMPFFSSILSIAVRTTVPPMTIVESLRQELRGASGDQALYEVHTMEELVSASLERQRFLLFLFGIFAGLALLLACIGIYGVLAYLTSQRIPEIGVRMTLGATAQDVLRLILGESLVMISIGVGTGTIAALLTGRVLTRLVEGMRPAALSTFAVTIPVLLLAALFASFIPARRASHIDPMDALRQQ
jgi:predicted permease